MPTYTLPKRTKNPKQNYPSVVDDSEWRRRVTVPVNKAIIDSVMAGKTVDVHLVGKVIGTQYSERDGVTSGTVEVDIDTVAIYGAKKESAGEYIKKRMKE